MNFFKKLFEKLFGTETKRKLEKAERENEILRKELELKEKEIELLKREIELERKEVSIPYRHDKN